MLKLILLFSGIILLESNSAVIDLDWINAMLLNDSFFIKDDFNMKFI